MGNFLGSLAQTAVGFAPYALKAVRETEDRNLQQAAQKITQARQAKQDALAQAMGASTMAHNAANSAHLDAETDVLKQPKSDIKSTVFDQDGNPWNEHTDGTLSRASIRGQAPAAPVPPTLTPTDHPGDIDLREPQAVAQGQPQAPQVPQQPAPKFGTRAPAPPRDPVKDHAANRDYDVAHPLPEKPVQQSYTPFQGTDAEGKPVVRPFNTKTGQFGDVADVAPKMGTNGPSGSQQAQQARLLAAVSEARLADERMRAYEEKLLSGQTKISPLQQAAGSLTTNLADAHGVMGALTQAGSEYGLNHADPDYAQYLRDASTIGRAEQMMSPRGGNETMVRANALLSRAGTGAMANTINASRMARQALFGASGGIAQTMSPAQTEKLNAGVQRIKAGEHGGTTASKPVSAEDAAHAQRDPAFAKWLSDHGYQVP